jgi:quercetin dioxygenase-like cupin family protein
MIGMRIASCILAAGVFATATACSPTAERATAKAPAAAVASEHLPETLASQHPSETQSALFEQALPNVKGKTFTSVIVDFPPNVRAVPHRHGQAFLYAYVLEGTVRSQLAGEPVSLSA